VQALVAKTPYGMPRRTAVGFDYNRVTMLLAILEHAIFICIYFNTSCYFCQNFIILS
jgi:predicted ATP-dependent serine protease